MKFHCFIEKCLHKRPDELLSDALKAYQAIYWALGDLFLVEDLLKNNPTFAAVVRR